jgi:glutamate--cysteine ligase catalytic subunit
MGLLTVGKPMRWDKSKPHLNYVREHGVLQFLNVWHAVKDVKNVVLRWGDEIETHVMVCDHANKTIKLSPRAAEVSAVK